MDKGQRTGILVSLGLLVVVVVPLVFVVAHFLEQARTITHQETFSETGERLYRLGTDGFDSISVQRGSAMMFDGIVEKPSQICLDSVIVETNEADADSVRVWFFITNRTRWHLDSARILVVQGTDITLQDIRIWGAEWPASEEVSGTWFPMNLLPGQQTAALLLFDTKILTNPGACQGVILSTPTSAIR